jgi:membrane fusion protein (multidrug efflux system)
MPVQVRVDAFPNRRFQGQIEAIYPTTTDNARNLRLRITLANPTDLPLKTGLFARGTIRLRTYRDVPLVPKRALIEKGDTTRVFVVENSIARSRTLRVRASNDTAVYADGIQAGEQVVIRGQDLLSDGQSVRIVGGSPTPARSVNGSLPPSLRFPPLREGNRARVRFPLPAGGTCRRGSPKTVG